MKKLLGIPTSAFILDQSDLFQAFEGKTMLKFVENL